MLKDVDWSEDGTYSPSGKNKPIEFFNNALMNSTSFDLELGYFNSASINVLSYSFATFLKNGGKMRMAINHILSAKDKEAISNGMNGVIDEPFDIDDLKNMRKTLNEYGEHFFNCLSYLIQEKRIEIKIIKPRNECGIAHTKKGQFYDGETTVSFTGSANFTLGGFFNNREEISIFFSSSPDKTVSNHIRNQKKEFDDLMSGTAEDVVYLSTSDLEEAIRSTFGNQDIEDLLDVERKLRRYKERAYASAFFVGDSGLAEEPEFPYSSGPRDYQKEAFERWKANNQRGLFAMATGTGKTLTSLNVLLNIYKSKLCQYYKALILVPTITLVNQWEQECQKFNFRHIIKVYSKNPNWKDQLDRIRFNEKHKVKEASEPNYIIISTYASFSRTEIFKQLMGFAPDKLLLIADEAHNMGSPAILKKLPKIPYYRRIGLSATPERQFDDDTNKKLFEFFGAEKEYTFEYSMRAAIEKGVLCRYYYYPHLVRLTDDEMEKYVELSNKIAKYFNYKSGTFKKKDDILMALLLARKRIIHKAANKLEVFKKIIQNRYEEQGHLKYTLVYVPEGLTPDYVDTAGYFDNYEELQDDEDSERLINLFTNAIAEIGPYVTVRKFVSGEKDRDKILSDFASGRLQVLTSMKCLDEGVDVPRSELAIFCSSTGNPRQFIQRRGRVLRTHPDKYMAVLHDLVVVPEVNRTCDSFRMERSLVKTELMRVNNFAMLSENINDSLNELTGVMEHYGLNLFNNDNI